MRKNKDIRLKVKPTVGGVIWNIFKVIVYIVMFLAAMSFIISFVWILTNSFKTGIEYSMDSFLPSKNFDWQNYIQVINNLNYKGYNIFGMLINSLILVGWNVLVTLTLPHMAAYVLARFNFKFGRLLEAVIFASMVIPVIGTSSSTMWFLNSIGLHNTFLGVFILQMGSLGFGQIMLTTFYRGISSTYAEAAYIDGASEWKVFTRIYYPQAKAITLINVVQGVIAVWNDYMTGYLYLPDHPTLALGLQQMQALFVDFGFDYPVMFAGVILSMVPVLTLYFIFSKQIIENITVGAMK